MAERKVKQWITVNGVHIPIFEGQSKEQTIKKFIDRVKTKGHETFKGPKDQEQRAKDKDEIVEHVKKKWDDPERSREEKQEAKDNWARYMRVKGANQTAARIEKIGSEDKTSALNKEQEQAIKRFADANPWVKSAINKELESGKSWDDVMKQVYAITPEGKNQDIMDTIDKAKRYADAENAATAAYDKAMKTGSKEDYDEFNRKYAEVKKMQAAESSGANKEAKKKAFAEATANRKAHLSGEKPIPSSFDNMSSQEREQWRKDTKKAAEQPVKEKSAPAKKGEPEFKSREEAESFYRDKFANVSATYANKMAAKLGIEGRGKDKREALAKAYTEKWQTAHNINKDEDLKEKQIAQNKEQAEKAAADKAWEVKQRQIKKQVDKDVAALKRQLDNKAQTEQIGYNHKLDASGAIKSKRKFDSNAEYTLQDGSGKKQNIKFVGTQESLGKLEGVPGSEYANYRFEAGTGKYYTDSTGKKQEYKKQYLIREDEFDNNPNLVSEKKKAQSSKDNLTYNDLSDMIDEARAKYSKASPEEKRKLMGEVRWAQTQMNDMWEKAEQARAAKKTSNISSSAQLSNKDKTAQSLGRTAENAKENAILRSEVDKELRDAAAGKKEWKPNSGDKVTNVSYAKAENELFNAPIGTKITMDNHNTGDYVGEYTKTERGWEGSQQYKSNRVKPPLVNTPKGFAMHVSGNDIKVISAGAAKKPLDTDSAFSMNKHAWQELDAMADTIRNRTGLSLDEARKKLDTMSAAEKAQLKKDVYAKPKTSGAEQSKNTPSKSLTMDGALDQYQKDKKNLSPYQLNKRYSEESRAKYENEIQRRTLARDDYDKVDEARKAELRDQFETNKNPHRGGHLNMTTDEYNKYQERIDNWKAQREKYMANKAKQNAAAAKTAGAGSSKSLMPAMSGAKMTRQRKEDIAYELAKITDNLTKRPSADKDNWAHQDDKTWQLGEIRKYDKVHIAKPTKGGQDYIATVYGTKDGKRGYYGVNIRTGEWIDDEELVKKIYYKSSGLRH